MKSLTGFLLLCQAIFFVGANVCEESWSGTCINYVYNSCLSGYSYSLSGCAFQEMCCIPPIKLPPAPPLADGQCGVTYPETQAHASRIVGGTAAARGEFPWQVSLRAYVAGGHHMCGGILISDKWILSAAHCFRDATSKNPFAWNGILGDYDRGDIDGHEKLVKLDTLIIHSGFNQEFGNDVAMLRIATTNVSMYTRYVRPVCLPAAGESFQHMTCTVTGWGAAFNGGHGTRFLYKANIPLISNEVCSYLLDRQISDGELCAGEKMGGIDGDSGGPMVCLRDGVWKVAGIVSWGYHCADSYSPGVYTNVSYYRSWIDTVTQYYTDAPAKRGADGTLGVHYL
ncbi:hypothetical protein BaRGS_00024057 [Batillaria attramentaria]|uniref:Peptidase S1 domain-containing protein n=1 Tax=Batillaria attramentaria TaxID=370345 RepID=A0ABD0KC23_9CAEN